MAKTQSPLLGYNTNVRHKGKVFHIQTEDSGVAKPHVITHLFADGGRIIKSVKTSYADRLEANDLQVQVKKLMQDQHKAMFIALRDGVYDDQMEVTVRTPALAEPAPSSPAEAPVTLEAPAPVMATKAEPEVVVAADVPEDSIELDESSFVEDVPQTTASPQPAVAAPVVSSPPPLQPAATMTPIRTGARQSAGWPSAPARPSSPLGAAPSATTSSGPPPLRPPPARATTTAPLGQPTLAAASGGPTPPAVRPDKRTPAPSARFAPVFGERLVSERSLDDVILAYLAEEIGEKPKR